MRVCGWARGETRFAKDAGPAWLSWPHSFRASALLARPAAVPHAQLRVFPVPAAPASRTQTSPQPLTAGRRACRACPPVGGRAFLPFSLSLSSSLAAKHPMPVESPAPPAWCVVATGSEGGQARWLTQPDLVCAGGRRGPSLVRACGRPHARAVAADSHGGGGARVLVPFPQTPRPDRLPPRLSPSFSLPSPLAKPQASGSGSEW